MDYIGNKCPVCQKYFHADDDVVVCPECGTPHHRACYEQTGHCINEALHEQGFDYSQENNADQPKTKVCPACGKQVDNESFFCKYCGSPLSPDAQRENGQNARKGASAPFGTGQDQNSPFGVPFLDPLGGVPGDSDFGDGVTAGETAKYIKQNTPYFIRVFSNIKNFNKSKFNFAAALFTGGYLLYRKMYKIGAILASIQLLLMIVEAYISIAYSALFTDFSNAVFAASDSTSQMVANMYGYLEGLSATQLLVLYLPTFVDVVRLVLMIVLGVCFNRMYMNHCKNQILKIKADASSQESAETELQTKGGVNTALAASLMVTYLIIVYLPNIIINFF